VFPVLFRPPFMDIGHHLDDDAEATMTTDTPTTGRLSVNGVDMYYEVHGTGRPLVLLHGGMLTIDLSFGGILPALAKEHRVIAPELQGHGHTADCDRPLTIDNLADDVVALLDHLGVERADVLGFSLGGLTALRLAMRYPARVHRLVLASTHYRPEGYHEELRDPALWATSTRMPTESDFREMTESYERVAPDPGHFEDFRAKASTTVGAFEGWSADELRALHAPTLLLLGDNDFVTLEHATEMFGLIPDAQLAVLPRTNHNDVIRRAELVTPILDTFLGGDR
jgi:pimeloyl-ACP methyl ester carboxylesterase